MTSTEGTDVTVLMSHQSPAPAPNLLLLPSHPCSRRKSLASRSTGAAKADPSSPAPFSPRHPRGAGDTGWGQEPGSSRGVGDAEPSPCWEWAPNLSSALLIHLPSPDRIIPRKGVSKPAHSRVSHGLNESGILAEPGISPELKAFQIPFLQRSHGAQLQD